MATKKRGKKPRPRYWNDHLKGSALFKGTIAQIAKRAGVSEPTVVRLRRERVKEELAARGPAKLPSIEPDITKWRNVSGVPIFGDVLDLRELTALELLDRLGNRLRACKHDLQLLMTKHGYR